MFAKAADPCMEVKLSPFSTVVGLVGTVLRGLSLGTVSHRGPQLRDHLQAANSEKTGTGWC